jgi:hypothetical protein
VHRAAQDRLDARDDLVEAERLGDVVVAADGEAGDLVLGVVLRGEEEDGRGVPGARRRLVTPNPFMSGSMTSRMIRSGSSSSTAEMVWAPLPTARTANPANRRLVVRRSRMLGSSSTMRMRGPSLMWTFSAHRLELS